jgi:cell wall-associated NlpC family hydrolase
MKIEEFANLAIGVPFLDNGRDLYGWDCWGLVVRTFRECADIEVPGFDYVSALNADEVKAIFEETKNSWVEVLPGQEKPLDVIVLRNGSWPCHTGVVVKKGYMLHVDAKIDSCIEPYNSGVWKTRVVGIFRHKNTEIL